MHLSFASGATRPENGPILNPSFIRNQNNHIKQLLLSESDARLNLENISSYSWMLMENYSKSHQVFDNKVNFFKESIYVTFTWSKSQIIINKRSVYYKESKNVSFTWSKSQMITNKLSAIYS